MPQFFSVWGKHQMTTLKSYHRKVANDLVARCLTRGREHHVNWLEFYLRDRLSAHKKGCKSWLNITFEMTNALAEIVEQSIFHEVWKYYTYEQYMAIRMTYHSLLALLHKYDYYRHATVAERGTRVGRILQESFIRHRLMV